MESRLVETAPEHATAREVWLLGQPHLSEYLDFVKNTVVNGKAANPATLTEEWRQANAYYQELEDTEHGIADHAERRELDPGLWALASEVMADPFFRQTFDTVPATIEVVELDRLVVFQKCVTWNFVARVKERIGPDPDPEALFRFCLPMGERVNPVTIRRTGSRRYVFRSDSMDLRYHGTTLFEPEQIRNHETFGPMAGVVGMVVGFGANYLNVIRVDDRLLLHDGYHRACALRELGITHAPAVVQKVTCTDELEVMAKNVIARDPDFYFRSARPPLLKDFFDPKIRRTHQTPKIVKVIEVMVEVRDFIVPE
jgi:hypothetical protein